MKTSKRCVNLLPCEARQLERKTTTRLVSTPRVSVNVVEWRHDWTHMHQLCRALWIFQHRIHIPLLCKFCPQPQVVHQMPICNIVALRRNVLQQVPCRCHNKGEEHFLQTPCLLAQCHKISQTVTPEAFRASTAEREFRNAPVIPQLQQNAYHTAVTRPAPFLSLHLLA
jgi:hypothetical protein